MSKSNPTWCRHYRREPGKIGIADETCEAGVKYDAIPLPAGHKGWFHTVPCFFSNRHNKALCEHCDYPTKEEVEKSEREMDAHIQSIMKAVSLIDGSGKSQGVLICPKCTGELHFSVASNGHRRAHCKTPECISFVE